MPLTDSDLRWLSAEFKNIRDEIVLRAENHDAVHASETRRGMKWTGLATGIGAAVGAGCAAFFAFFTGTNNNR